MGHSKHIAIIVGLLLVHYLGETCGVTCQNYTHSRLDVTMTCFPKPQHSFDIGTYCITECDGNLVGHTCQDGGHWDIDIDHVNCLCDSIKSTRGGNWTCNPPIDSLSSSVKSDTKCIFTCGDDTLGLLTCNSGDWDTEPHEKVCEEGFWCDKLADVGNGVITCDDTYIEEDVSCSLNCNDNYSGGGYDKVTCTTNGSWSDARPFACTQVKPVPASGVLIIGGEGGEAGKELAEVEMFAPTTGAPCMNRLASIATGARAQHASVMLSDGKVVICGGKNVDGKKLLTCDKYDPVKDDWQEMTGALTSPRVDAAAVEFQGQLWVLGGYGDNETLSIVTEVYDGTNWNPGPLLPNNIRGLCAIVIDDHLYIVGGYADGQYSAKTYILEDGGQTWKELNDMNLERERHACIYVEMNALRGIMVSGGRSGAAYQTAEFYPLTIGKWQVLGSMIWPRYGHGLVQLDNHRVMAFGGVGLDSVEEYVAGDTDAWSIVGSNLTTSKYHFTYVKTSSCLQPV